MAVKQSPDKPQVFRSPTAVVVWVVWLLFAVANWIDLAAQGRDHASAVAAAILLLATGIAYVTAQRPRIIADEAGVTVRNPLRDHRIGWGCVAKVDLADLLRVHYASGEHHKDASGEHHKVISAWAVHYSRRRQLAAEARSRRAARPAGLRRSSLGFPSGDRGPSYGASVSAPEASSAEASSAEAEAKKVVRVLSERATAAQAQAQAQAEAEAGWPGGSEPLRSTWSGRAIAALAIPALILLLVWLL